MTATADNLIDRFSMATCIRGPHSIPRSRQTKNQFHRLFSIKAGNRLVMAESGLEADAIIWAESQVDIVSLCEQPIRIMGVIEKKPYYTFDLGVRMNSGEEVLYEIKPTHQLVESDNGNALPRNWDYISAWCGKNGYTCKVITDTFLQENEMLISNWRTLIGFVRIAESMSDKKLSEKVLDIITHAPEITVASIDDCLSNHDTQYVIATIAGLMHKGQVTGGLDTTAFDWRTELHAI